MSKKFLNGTRFFKDSNGGTTLQVALLFGAIGLAVALLATPALDAASQRIASSEYGVDQTVTGSVSKSSKYILRRSILSPEPQKICKKDEYCD